VHPLKIDIIERLAVEARNQRHPPVEYVYDPHGNRAVHHPQPDIDMADLLEDARSEILWLRAELDVEMTDIEEGR